MQTVRVEWEYKPRSYQLKLLEAMRAGCKRAVCVWHRRAGKDMTAFNWMISQAIQIPGVYYYFFPTYAQGKKILWNGIDGNGKKFLDYIPKELIIGEPHQTEMLIKLRTLDGRESVFQIIGTDNMDSVVGTNPRGCIFSEYSLQNPRGWDLIRPILRENRGWAIFLYTPRGRNHGWRLFENAKGLSEWFVDLKTVRETYRDAPGEDGSIVVSEADVEEDRRSGMDPDLVEQEYYCSFAGALQGSYFGHLLSIAENEGRITTVPWDSNRLVQTAWDIGIGDENAIWLWQHSQGGMVNLIDYIEDRSKGLPYYAKILMEKQWGYGYHIFPFDVSAKEWATGRKRVEVARGLLGRVKVAKKYPIDERIDMTRRFFHRFRWDKDKCQRGLDAIASYMKKYDENRQVYGDKPEHTWASHGSEALQHLVLGYEPEDKGRPRQTHAVSEFDPMGYENVRQKTYKTDYDPMEVP